MALFTKATAIYAHLSTKEKQKELVALARKGAILWSTQDKRKRQLQASAPVAQLLTSVDPIFYPA